MNDNYITIASFTYESEMVILLGKLESEGIRCFTRNRTIIGIRPLLSNALGGIQLSIHKDDLEEALEILKGFEKDKQNFKLDIIYKDVRYEKTSGFCPQCDENSIYVERKTVLNKILDTFLLKKEKYYCNSCKHLWIE